MTEQDKKTSRTIVDFVRVAINLGPYQPNYKVKLVTGDVLEGKITFSDAEPEFLRLQVADGEDFPYAIQLAHVVYVREQKKSE